MGVIGQAHSIAGLAAAYALPPSALPPRTPNHEYDLGPPRTPGDGGSNQLSLDGTYQMGGAGSSAQPIQFGRSNHGQNLASSSYNYNGGQYGKYGKRY